MDDSQGVELGMEYATSPTGLQEVTLPDGNDLTVASGISMKQFEDQLNGLRKENFNLKLRVYFLEQRLALGSPADIQPLHLENVKLKVELEELRRQFEDQQQLLAAAAQAIDVLEQQGSVCTESANDSSHDSTKLRGKLNKLREPKESGDYENNSDDDDQLDADTQAADQKSHVCKEKKELAELKETHKKALYMICKCYKDIQAKEKQIKLLTKERDALNERAPNEELDNMLKEKDEIIDSLKQKLELVSSKGKENDGNLQEVLTKRLQNLAFFLDKLLANKCVLGEDKQRIAENLLEQSLALGAGLELDESLVPTDFQNTFTDEDFDVSQALRLQDLTLMLGHHRLDHFPTDSECWSEPDREISSARIGLAKHNGRPSFIARHSIASGKSRKGKQSFSDEELEKANWIREKVDLEMLLQTECDRSSKLQAELAKVNDEMKAAKSKVDELTIELIHVKAELKAKDENITLFKEERERALADIGELREQIHEKEMRANEVEMALVDADMTIRRLREERLRYEEAVAERERELIDQADRAALAAGEAALKRALRIQLPQERDVSGGANGTMVEEVSRPTSPDQGIDSDRLSSLDADVNEPRSIAKENVELRDELSRCRAALVDALRQLKEANCRKLAINRAICKQLHRTHGVLRQARGQLEPTGSQMQSNGEVATKGEQNKFF